MPKYKELTKYGSSRYTVYMIQSNLVSFSSEDKFFISNKVANAGWNLPVLQMKLVMLALTSIRSDNNPDLVVEMRMDDIIKALALTNGGSAYREVIATCDGAMDKHIRINMTNGDIEAYHWFRSYKYVKSKHSIEIRFDNEIFPFLVETKKFFTAYLINRVRKLQSRYSEQIYLAVISKQGLKGKDGNKKNNWYIDIDFENFRALLDMGENEYKFKTDFRKNVVDKPVKEINDANLGIHIVCDYEKHRHGKRLDGVRLNVEKIGKNDPVIVSPATQTEIDEFAKAQENEYSTIATEDEDEKKIREKRENENFLIKKHQKQYEFFCREYITEQKKLYPNIPESMYTLKSDEYAIKKITDMLKNNESKEQPADSNAVKEQSTDAEVLYQSKISDKNHKSGNVGEFVSQIMNKFERIANKSDVFKEMALDNIRENELSKALALNIAQDDIFDALAVATKEAPEEMKKLVKKLLFETNIGDYNSLAELEKDFKKTAKEISPLTYVATTFGMFVFSVGLCLILAVLGIS